MQLRDYQIQAVNFLRNELYKDKITIVTAPTGIGKTMVLNEVVKNNKLQIVVCLPSFKHYYQQTLEIDNDYITTPHFILKDKLNLSKINTVYLAGLNQILINKCIEYISKNYPSICIVIYN